MQGLTRCRCDGEAATCRLRWLPVSRSTPGPTLSWLSIETGSVRARYKAPPDARPLFRRSCFWHLLSIQTAGRPVRLPLVMDRLLSEPCLDRGCERAWTNSRPQPSSGLTATALSRGHGPDSNDGWHWVSALKDHKGILWSISIGAVAVHPRKAAGAGAIVGAELASTRYRLWPTHVQHWCGWHADVGRRRWLPVLFSEGHHHSAGLPLQIPDADSRPPPRPVILLDARCGFRQDLIPELRISRSYFQVNVNQPNSIRRPSPITGPSSAGRRG